MPTPDIEQAPFMRDREDALTPSETMAGAKVSRKGDLYSVIAELLDEKKVFVHGNLANNRVADQILQARTVMNMADTIMESFTNDNSPLTEKQKERILALMTETRKTVIGVTEDHAKLRLTVKGFRSKQIEDILKVEHKVRRGTLGRLARNDPNNVVQS